ncbi:calcium/proton exchanger [Auriscalpium vulgare]|uniref:Calcium/proton exchanger n=1 Tax=Auriscalpium vulgare TaxID=40419 RepID=A0ACB8S0Z0_9AGAM|nr:calcium/proton exchanger [Auriscalpium vulgare]
MTTPVSSASHIPDQTSPSADAHTVDRPMDNGVTHEGYEPTPGAPSENGTHLSKWRWRGFKGTWRYLHYRHKPEHKIGDAPSAWGSFVSIAKSSWLNLLLVFIPLSWAFHWAKMDDTLIFVFSFLAIIPLAKLLAFATDELSMRVGQTLAGLLNATLGNAVELIVAIIALTKCELSVVQSSLIGSVLSNLLLVLGMCFFAGGMRFSEQGFGMSATQLNSSLLFLSVIGLLIPAAFHIAVQPSTDTSDPFSDPQEGARILKISHGTAIIMLFIYACYLVFQLFSHKNLYEDANAPKSIPFNWNRDTRTFDSPEKAAEPNQAIVHTGVESAAASPAMTQRVGTARTGDAEQGPVEEEEVEKPSMSVPMTIALLAAVTVLVALTAEFLVDSINGLTEKGGISKEFVGVILLPIVGNAAEHVTAVTVSVKDKLTLSLGVAVGSSIQIALFVIPFIVTLGWMLDKPLTMLFDPLQSVVLFLAVLAVNYATADGRSNWLEGMILMCLYLILALVFWFYPGVNPSDTLLQCH